MIPNATLTLVDGVRIVVPDSLDLITTYVLREQQDWFEDEIGFVRQLLQPGQCVIDIGANYGAYTLAMARLVGPAGRVLAFEPTSRTAELLAESIALNGFGHIVLEKLALSSAEGTAQISLHDNAELNALVHDSEPGGVMSGDTELVTVMTLDRYLQEHDWPDIDFLKLDAEGEEANILLGGTQFFTVQSPLIQYEVKAGRELHLELVNAFSRLGYTSYRLVPGLNILTPFDPDELADGFLLNLFCCKPDRARQLAGRGLLTESIRQPDVPVDDAQDAWLTAITRLSYGQGCSQFWNSERANGRYREIAPALACYVRSQDTGLSVSQRFQALQQSYSQLRTLCNEQPVFLRLSSLARVAREYGDRTLSVAALGQLFEMIFQHHMLDPGEPFLAPGRRFDSVSVNNSLTNWVGAAVLEELERNSAFSSFYTGESARQRLEFICKLGYGSDEMFRRLDLLQQRFGNS